jgi:hypothetical protein
MVELSFKNDIGMKYVFGFFSNFQICFQKMPMLIYSICGANSKSSNFPAKSCVLLPSNHL